MSASTFFINFQNDKLLEVVVDDLAAVKSIAKDYISLTTKDIIICDQHKKPLCISKWVLAKPDENTNFLCKVAGVGYYKEWEDI